VTGARLAGPVATLDERGRIVEEAELCAEAGAGARRATPIASAEPAKLATAYTEALRGGDCPLVLSPQLSADARQSVIAAARGSLPAPGHLLCTSGTTSKAPKVYFVSLDAALGNARAHVRSLGMDSSDERILLPMSMSHSFGLVAAALGSAVLGARLLAFRATPDPATLLQTAAAERVTTLYLIPPLLRLLLRRLRRRPAPALPELRRISVGSAPVSRAELAALAKHFPGVRVTFTYGLTELGPRVSTYVLAAGTDSEPDNSPLPIGEPIDRVTLEVREPGELYVRSPWAAAGRWLDGRLTPIAGDDGFVATGDAARREGGAIYLGGRRDGVIVMGGGNVYPEDLERVADGVDGVAASCALGRASAVYGEVPILAVELVEGADQAATLRTLRERLQAALPPSHQPVEIQHIALPRTAAGKVARAAARAALLETA
jgi:acyl-CoA synthetase (AMP-forming)/AMP-acid ligase II